MTQWKPRSSGSALPIEEWRVATTNAGVFSESVVTPSCAPLTTDGPTPSRRPARVSWGVLACRQQEPSPALVLDRPQVVASALDWRTARIHR